MKFDAVAVIEAHGASALGEQFAHYRSIKPSKLLVCFSDMDARESFNRLSWFWDQDQQWADGVSFLFLRDTTFSDFLGNDAAPKRHTYQKIIDKALEQNGLERSQALTVGSSMGGHAAILYAFQMALAGAIVGVPQVNKSCARMHRHGRLSPC
ncbi:MAG: hypothetical protein QE285_03075 [Aquabacterium sp.]|nr:hypothetical protein [Aquabacterium sp.]